MYLKNMNMHDFSQNFNVIVNKDKFKNILETSSLELFRYPQWKKKKLTKFIAKDLGLTETSIAIGNGTTEVIFTLPRIFDKKKALILSPSFWEYHEANKRYKDIKISFFQLKEADNFELNQVKFERKIKEFSTIYLCNPNNPTSTLIKKSFLVNIIKKNPRSIFIIDETYLIFREDYEKQTLSKEAALFNNLYIVTSFSKFFSIPGLRIGILISNPTNIKRYNESSIPYLINPMSEIIVPYLLNQKKLFKETREFYKKQRAKVYELFLKNFDGKLKVYKPEANFILIKIMTDLTSQEVVKKLRKKGIIIRDGTEFKSLENKYFRLAIKTDDEMTLLITSLKRIIDDN